MSSKEEFLKAFCSLVFWAIAFGTMLGLIYVFG